MTIIPPLLNAELGIALPSNEWVAMELNVRRWLCCIETRLEEAGRPDGVPLRKAAAVAFVANPYTGRRVEDLSEAIEASAELGRRLAGQLLEVYGDHPIQAYGKAGVAGIAGEQEHANALLTTTAAEPFRKAIGSGKAWISSVTKIGSPGTTVDVPLACTDALYVRSHYNAITVHLPDGPLPDEIAVIFAIANRGRLHARVGGLRHEDMQGLDGLR